MSILDEIVRHKRQEVSAQKAATPRRALEARCATLAAPRDFERALAPVPGRARLVAEVKRASPSRGVLKADLDPVALASTYARHGVDAISVLTDAKYFRGSLDDLAAVRAAVDVPLLRKDFTLDEYQLWEARAAGADAVLLIVAILEPALLSDLAAAAKGLGLAALVECHTAPELDKALASGARLIGINNRDLATFDTRIDTTLALLPHIPPGPTVVSESGFFSGDDVRRVIEAGAHAVLVGEGLVKAADVGAKVRELRLTESGGKWGGRLVPPIHK
jgi:indole-3-glycerol phosphate synthase